MIRVADGLGSGCLSAPQSRGLADGCKESPGLRSVEHAVPNAGLVRAVAQHEPSADRRESVVSTTQASAVEPQLRHWDSMMTLVLLIGIPLSIWPAQQVYVSRASLSSVVVGLIPVACFVAGTWLVRSLARRDARYRLSPHGPMLCSSVALVVYGGLLAWIAKGLANTTESGDAVWRIGFVDTVGTACLSLGIAGVTGVVTAWAGVAATARATS